MLSLLKKLWNLLFGRKAPQVNPDVLQGEINELKKQNTEIKKDVESKKNTNNTSSEIEDYFNKKR
jgi:FtsZ-binding cell division protein ZapB